MWVLTLVSVLEPLGSGAEVEGPENKPVTFFFRSVNVENTLRIELAQAFRTPFLLFWKMC